MPVIVAKISNIYMLRKCNKVFKVKMKFYYDSELSSNNIMGTGSTSVAIQDGSPFSEIRPIIKWCHGTEAEKQ